MRGGRFLISVVTACLLVGCSSGSWTTIEGKVWEVETSEPAFLMTDNGPIEGCTLRDDSDPETEEPTALSDWGWSRSWFVPDSKSEGFYPFIFRNCVGLKYTFSIELFSEFLADWYETEKRHRCEGEVKAYELKLDLEDLYPLWIDLARDEHVVTFFQYAAAGKEASRLVAIKDAECERKIRQAEDD
jgi:hypothetical protein